MQIGLASGPRTLQQQKNWRRKNDDQTSSLACGSESNRRPGQLRSIRLCCLSICNFTFHWKNWMNSFFKNLKTGNVRHFFFEFFFFFRERRRTLFIQVSPHFPSPVSGLKGAIYFNVEQLKGWWWRGKSPPPADQQQQQLGRRVGWWGASGRPTEGGEPNILH